MNLNVRVNNFVWCNELPRIFDMYDVYRL